MFEIIPSIWLINGKCVRLKRGDFATEEVISHNPLEIAQAFEGIGIKRVHLVDLDGARRGEPKNYNILEAIAGYTDLEVDFTGGITTDGDVIKCFEFGAKTVTIASAAAKHPERFAQFILSYGREKIYLAADTNPNDYKIKIKGWLTKTELEPEPPRAPPVAVGAPAPTVTVNDDPPTTDDVVPCTRPPAPPPPP